LSIVIVLAVRGSAAILFTFFSIFSIGLKAKVFVSRENSSAPYMTINVHKFTIAKTKLTKIVLKKLQIAFFLISYYIEIIISKA